MATNDNSAQITIAATAAVSHGVWCRGNSNITQGYLWRNDGTSWNLFSVVGGSFVSIGSFAGAAVAGDVAKIQAVGSTIKGFVNGVQRVSVTDTAVATGTSVGLCGPNPPTCSASMTSPGRTSPPAPRATRHSSSTATLSAAGLRATAGGAALAPTAGLTAAGVRATGGGASLTALAGLTAAGVRATAGGAALTSTAALTADGVRAASGGAGLASTAGLVADGIRGTSGDTGLAVSATLIAAGAAGRGLDAALAVTVALTAVGAIGSHVRGQCRCLCRAYRIRAGRWCGGAWHCQGGGRRQAPGGAWRACRSAGAAWRVGRTDSEGRVLVIDLGSVYQVAVDVADASGHSRQSVVPPHSRSRCRTGRRSAPPCRLPTTAREGARRLRDRPGGPTCVAARHLWSDHGVCRRFRCAARHPVGIVSLADARAQLNFRAAETSDDDELRGFIGAATGAVERALGRVVVRRSVTDRFEMSGAVAELLLRNVPVLSLTSAVSADGATTWSTAGLRVDAETGLVTVASGPAFTGALDVTYQAGEVVVPEDYRLAGKIILQHLWETQRGTMGVQLGGDNEPYMPGRGFAIPRQGAGAAGSAVAGGGLMAWTSRLPAAMDALVAAFTEWPGLGGAGVTVRDGPSTSQASTYGGRVGGLDWAPRTRTAPSATLRDRGPGRHRGPRAVHDPLRGLAVLARRRRHLPGPGGGPTSSCRRQARRSPPNRKLGGAVMRAMDLLAQS
jgi:hypothetical protein